MSQAAPKTDTRSRFIAAAAQLFAERGFYGASMDQIARELGLTKQALIHHFGTKEKLYGEVLSEISESLLNELKGQGTDAPGEPEGAFSEALLRIYERTRKQPAETLLLMRELLDNRHRAPQAGSWYLRPFLDELEQLLAQKPAWRNVDRKVRATHVFQLLGAINYFAVSAETLRSMYSARHHKAMTKNFPNQLRLLAETGPAEV